MAGSQSQRGSKRAERERKTGGEEKEEQKEDGTGKDDTRYRVSESSERPRGREGGDRGRQQPGQTRGPGRGELCGGQMGPRGQYLRKASSGLGPRVRAGWPGCRRRRSTRRLPAPEGAAGVPRGGAARSPRRSAEASVDFAGNVEAV